MNKSIVKGALGGAALMALSMTGQTASADAISDIKAAGVLKVGVKADYKPYGFLIHQVQSSVSSLT